MLPHPPSCRAGWRRKYKTQTQQLEGIQKEGDTEEDVTGHNIRYSDEEDDAGVTYRNGCNWWSPS